MQPWTGLLWIIWWPALFFRNAQETIFNIRHWNVFFWIFTLCTLHQVHGTPLLNGSHPPESLSPPHNSSALEKPHPVPSFQTTSQPNLQFLVHINCRHFQTSSGPYSTLTQNLSFLPGLPGLPPPVSYLNRLPFLIITLPLFLPPPPPQPSLWTLSTTHTLCYYFLSPKCSVITFFLLFSFHNRWDLGGVRFRFGVFIRA